MKTKTITEFYEKDYPSYVAYDNIRKICGTDGMKISQRKLIWSAFDRCYDNWIKTDTFCAQCQIDTNYIHGSANLEGVVDNLAADFIGANNYPLITGNSGGFGNRLQPDGAAAGRYTRVKLSPIAKALFKKEDNEILEKQYFEGQYIEPKFLMPVFPTTFLNGSHGLSTAFSHDIYPRNPDEVIEYIKKRLAGVEKPRMSLLPWFKGHLGKVAYNKDLARNESFGVITKNTMTSYTITELPIEVNYQKYKEYLDKLCDNGTIVDYTDKCDTDGTIYFELKTTREFTRTYEKDERRLLEVLHLVKGLPETLCIIDGTNKAKEYATDIKDILNDFIDIRLEFYDKRKAHILKTLEDDIAKLSSKYLFVKGIVDEKIIVNKKKKDEVVAQLVKVKDIIKVNDSYDYLLSMAIHSLTKEKLEELKKQIEMKKEEHKAVKATTIEDMWIADLDEFKKVIK